MQLKWCYKCGEIKGVIEFGKSSRDDGYRSECKKCQKEYNHRYRLNRIDRKQALLNKSRYDRNRYNNDPVGIWYVGCKKQAKRRGIEFIVTLEEIHSIWTGKCEESGVEFTFNNDSNSPTMDRLNPDGIYQIDNIRIVTSYVNAKRGRKLLEEGWRGVYAN